MLPVPKVRTSRSRRNTRRSHHGLAAINYIFCRACGKAKFPHRVCAACGTYNDTKVIAQVETASADSEFEQPKE